MNRNAVSKLSERMDRLEQEVADILTHLKRYVPAPLHFSPAWRAAPFPYTTAAPLHHVPPRSTPPHHQQNIPVPSLLTSNQPHKLPKPKSSLHHVPFPLHHYNRHHCRSHCTIPPHRQPHISPVQSQTLHMSAPYLHSNTTCRPRYHILNLRQHLHGSPDIQQLREQLNTTLNISLTLHCPTQHHSTQLHTPKSALQTQTPNSYSTTHLLPCCQATKISVPPLRSTTTRQHNMSTRNLKVNTHLKCHPLDAIHPRSHF